MANPGNVAGGMPIPWTEHPDLTLWLAFPATTDTGILGFTVNRKRSSFSFRSAVLQGPISQSHTDQSVRTFAFE
jgi:hypothetical protein